MYEQEDHYCRIFIGSTYEISASTVRELKKTLEDIAADLPTDLEGKLKISSIELWKGKLYYYLEEGIIE